MHSKVLTVVAPGGMVVDATMTGNLNTAAVGLAALDLPPGPERSEAPKSFERLTAVTASFSSEEGQAIVKEFCNLWGHFATHGWIIWNAPILMESLRMFWLTKSAQTPQLTTGFPGYLKHQDEDSPRSSFRKTEHAPEAGGSHSNVLFIHQLAAAAPPDVPPVQLEGEPSKILFEVAPQLLASSAAVHQESVKKVKRDARNEK